MQFNEKQKEKLNNWIYNQLGTALFESDFNKIENILTENESFPIDKPVMQLGHGKDYEIIYADPPWKYKSKGMYQETFPKRKQVRKYQGVNDHYNTLNLEDLKNIGVAKITAKNCALFLWAVDSHLPEALELIKAWGFKYRSIAFVWVKRSSKNKLCANVGAWTMKNTEICLIATKGNMAKQKIANNIYQVIEEERTKHSKKPNEARKRIEAIFGDKKRIELFARGKFDGWDAWGDQVPQSA